MNHSSLLLSPPTVPPDVCEFAVEQGISGSLTAVIELSRSAFPSSDLCVSLARDDEDEAYYYVAIDIESNGLTTEELLTGQRIWSEGIVRVCPSSHAVHFVLGWR